MSDPIEEGYKLLADDPEMQRPNRKSFKHHCGFDFIEGQATVSCSCGAVATNPYYVMPIKGEVG